MTRTPLVLAAAALAAGALAAPSTGATTKTVKDKDDVFSPTSLKITRGTKVRFVWRGEAPHNVRAVSGPRRFTSKVQTSGTYSYTFRKKGKYELVCTIHAPSMKMTVRVR